jgi:tripartite-type tricarboxylate transporter receptor subunit TctC
MRTFAELARISAFGLLLALAGPALAQQDYPNKPIRFIVPFPPGGSTTIIARLFGQKLTESWGQQVIVDNRGGGNTIIGSEALVKSPPDGYTILLVTATHVINPSLLTTPYDALKDFAPVATVVGTETMLVVSNAVPANNLREFIALAKAKPGQLNFGSSGSGTSNHLMGELFCIVAGVKIQHVPYKGAGPALVDLIGGQVQMFTNNGAPLIPLIKSGKIKGMAISGEARSPAVPQVPTFTEAGLPGVNMNTWQGILAPAGTPKAVIDKLAQEIARILAMPDFKEKLASNGADPFINTPEQFAALMKTDLARYAKLIKEANIKLEN